MPDSVSAIPLDGLLGKPHASPPPRPYEQIYVDRVENGFTVRAFDGRDSVRIAHTPAEAGAAVAELLARHMPAEALAGAPRLALIPGSFGARATLASPPAPARPRPATKAPATKARAAKAPPAKAAARAAGTSKPATA